MLARSTQKVLLSQPIFHRQVLKRAHHCEPASPLFDWRRRKDRSHWSPYDKEFAQEVGVCGFGYHGYDMETNWTLAFESVHPDHQAFRNLHNRGLSMYFQGTKDKNHALHTTIHSKPIQTFYRFPTKEELEAEWQSHTKSFQDYLDAEAEYLETQEGATPELIEKYKNQRKEATGAEKEAYDQEDKAIINRYFRPQEEESYPLIDWLSLPKNAALSHSQIATSFPRDLKRFLSTFQDKLYVQDGVFGSDPRTELRVRLITNSPNMALVFSNMVFKISSQVTAREFRPPLTVFHAVDFLEENPATNYGVEGDQDLAFVDFLKSGMFLGGRAVEDVQVLRSLLAKASFHYFPNRSIVPLPAYVFTPSPASSPVVILGNPESTSLERFFFEQGNKNIYANQYATWSDYGVSALLSDLPTQSLQRGDVVQHILNKNKEERVNYIARRKGVPTVIPHPKKIVLVSNTSSSASSPSELINEHLTQNFSSFPVQLAKWVEALNKNVEKHQVKVEKVTLKSDSVDQLKQSLSSVLA